LLLVIKLFSDNMLFILRLGQWLAECPGSWQI